MKTIQEAAVRQELFRLAMLNELKLLKKAVAHYQATGRLYYEENGISVVLSEWTLAKLDHLSEDPAPHVFSPVSLG